jgi:hypothetical protein
MSFETGTVVKNKNSNNHYTVVDDRQWFSHKDKVIVTSMHEGNFEAVYPKPRDPKIGDVVQHSATGYVYTITSDDKFFNHRHKEIVRGDNGSAVDHIKAHRKYYDILT